MRVFPHGQVRASIENGFASMDTFMRGMLVVEDSNECILTLSRSGYPRRGEGTRKIEGTEYVHTALHTTWNEVEGLWSHLIWTADNW